MAVCFALPYFLFKFAKMKEFRQIGLCQLFVWMMVLCGVALVGCSQSAPAERSILPPDVVLQTGDVVFRLGGGAMSHAVAYIDRDGAYSHVGIVVDSAGKKMIVHAVPGEPDFDGDPDRVKMDTPERFFSSINANTGEVCRPLDREVAARAAAAAMKFYERRALFDHHYDANDSTEVYCTELIVRAFEGAGQPLVGPPTHEFDLPGVHTVCWLPSDIHHSPYLKTISIF